MKKQMGGLISNVHKRRGQFSYSVKMIKYLIRSLHSQTHAIKDSQDLASPKTPKMADFDHEYQVFQIVESEVHKVNPQHVEKVKKIKENPERNIIESARGKFLSRFSN